MFRKMRCEYCLKCCYVISKDYFSKVGGARTLIIVFWISDYGFHRTGPLKFPDPMGPAAWSSVAIFIDLVVKSPGPQDICLYCLPLCTLLVTSVASCCLSYFLFPRDLCRNLICLFTTQKLGQPNYMLIRSQTTLWSNGHSVRNWHLVYKKIPEQFSEKSRQRRNFSDVRTHTDWLTLCNS